MPNQKNLNIVSELKDKLARSKSLVVTDYKGLTHKQTEQLHRDVKKTGGEYLVAKNSLLKIAAKDNGYSLEEVELKGTNGFLIGYEDEVSSIKELAKFIKTNTLPKIKFGFIGKNQYDGKQVEAIAKLPGKQELQGMVVSRLSGPLYGLMYALNGNIQKLVYVLNAIKK
jgi:large subunit ribosomal protein L10